ncbi:hypothetical protein CERZMDRAFT_91171 [Cercospora zeae-maydis SCOH1-5]|uniref:Uncharacterized protein n=1 Tax=Cercospora zeae-maydis SCOH1-5 TaxID=717836 RepID=A0A6A6FAQ2_9PEZI|nr:hypothetical protein CERZMDRAFT_91171 [Cercospora zeae-maydis SCOH1-5]
MIWRTLRDCARTDRPRHGLMSKWKVQKLQYTGKNSRRTREHASARLADKAHPGALFLHRSHPDKARRYARGAQLAGSKNHLMFRRHQLRSACERISEHAALPHPVSLLGLVLRRSWSALVVIEQASLPANVLLKEFLLGAHGLDWKAGVSQHGFDLRSGEVFKADQLPEMLLALVCTPE